MPTPRRMPLTASSPRTSLPNARRTPRYAGVATFCRFPRLEDVPAGSRPVDWVMYGVPYDSGVTYRPGARFGPREIRTASQYIKPVHPLHGINLAEVLSLADGGDAPVQPWSCAGTMRAVSDFAETIGEPGHTKLLAVGGDHSIAYANIRATWIRRGRPAKGLAMIHFDAHMDTVDVIGEEKFTHASPFRRAIEEGFIDPKAMISIGVRGPLNALSDLEYAREVGMTLVTYEEWRIGGGAKLLGKHLKKHSKRETYLSFDIDCVDPAFAPGTGTPCCGGFTSAEVFEALRSCAGVNLVGADIVEVLPDRDMAGITSLLAAHVMYEVLALGAVHTLQHG